MTDVIVVGGGVIGLSIAYELAGQGAAVRVLEAGDFGREASWAGAGILPPGNPKDARSPAAHLRAESHIRWAGLSRRLAEETGIDGGFRECGGIALDLDGSADGLRAETEHWRSEGVDLEELSGEGLRDREPALTREVAAAYRLPALAQVRNPRHLKALQAGCAARGVELLAGSPVVAFERRGERVLSARTPSETYRAGRFCVATGAWTRRLLAPLGLELPVEPIRGQIVMLTARPLPFRHVVEIGSRYLVPRPDGRVLLGSTEERAGFDRSTTAAAVADLLALAVRVVPALADAAVERTWAGLRPASADGLPYLGRIPETNNLFVAAGHFRSGLQTSPATAAAMAALILEQELPLPLEPFACNRHGAPVA